MDNPFGPPSRRRGQSPPAKNNFQHELHAKMYERKKKGLTADVTPSESGQSEDELGSDNELMAGFQMSSKSRSPGRKSPHNEMNGYGKHKPSKNEIIFGSKYGTHYDDDDDDDGLANAPNELLMTMKKPMVMTGKGAKKQQHRQMSPLALREEDEVDADMSNMAQYMKQDQKKQWQPPSFQKPSSMEKDYDHEQLQLDLHKTKHRPKSPKPGRKTPSDLDSITEERELDLDNDEDLSPKVGSGRQYGSQKSPKPVPKPRVTTKPGKPGARTSPTADLKNKPRVASPSTDLFGSSKHRSKSPFEKDSLEKEDFKSFLKNKDKKEKDKKDDKKDKAKSPSILDMMSGSSSKQDPKSNKKDSKTKKAGKGKYLGQDSDSDDSIGGEFKRKDDIPRKKSYGKEDPLGRFSPVNSPYDREKGDRFDPRNRRSPLDQSGRKSPLDSFSRSSPYNKEKENPYDKRGGQIDKKKRSPYSLDDRGDDRRKSPMSVTEDRTQYDRHSPKDWRSQGDSIYENKNDRTGRDKSPSQQKENPFARKSSKDRGDGKRDRSNDRDYRDNGDRDNHYGDRDNRYGDRDQTDFRNKYKDSDRDRYGYDDLRKGQYRHGDEDRLGRKSPFSRDYEDSRKSPFEKRGDHRGYDDMDRGLGRDKRVGFEQDMSGPPSLKGKYDKDRHSPFGRDKDDYPDRKPSLRRDDRDEYDKYSRQKFEESKNQERSRSRNRGKKDDDRESSLCRDVDEDPSKMKKAPTEEEETLKKHKVKSHTKENALLDQVIESVKEEQTKFKPVDPDKSKDRTEGKQRSQSARHRPKPRYAKPVVESFPSRPSTAHIDPNNTHSIRDAVFMDWYKDRNEKARKEKEEKLKKEKEEVERKKKEEEDKKLESMASYNAWAEKKKEYLSEQQKKKRKEERKKEKELEEKQERKQDAAKSFRLWKEDKDTELHSKERQKKREELEKLEEEKYDKEQKKKEAKTAYKSWNEKKEVSIREKEYGKRQDAAKKQREERRQKEHREKEAMKSYDQWMQKKAKNERQNRKSMKTRRLEEMNDPRPAWSPASKTIPFGR